MFASLPNPYNVFWILILGMFVSVGKLEMSFSSQTSVITFWNIKYSRPSSGKFLKRQPLAYEPTICSKAVECTGWGQLLEGSVLLSLVKLSSFGLFALKIVDISCSSAFRKRVFVPEPRPSLVSTYQSQEI